MNALFFALVELAVVLSPDDPATAFMWLVTGLIGTTEFAVIYTFAGLQQFFERRRDRARLAADPLKDAAAWGDYVHVLPKTPSHAPMPHVNPTLGPRPPVRRSPQGVAG